MGKNRGVHIFPNSIIAKVKHEVAPTSKTLFDCETDVRGEDPDLFAQRKLFFKNN